MFQICGGDRDKADSTKSKNISCILEAGILYDTILETGWKKEIFGNDPRIICSKMEKMVQFGPKTKNFVFQDIKKLSMGKLVLE